MFSARSRKKLRLVKASAFRRMPASSSASSPSVSGRFSFSSVLKRSDCCAHFFDDVFGSKYKIIIVFPTLQCNECGNMRLSHSSSMVISYPNKHLLCLCVMDRTLVNNIKSTFLHSVHFLYLVFSFLRSDIMVET